VTLKPDILTPIHKALRAMIYDLGGRLQTTDFSDADATDAVLSQLHREFTPAITGNCILCLLHQHAGHEEVAAFPHLARFEPALVDRMVRQHAQIVQQLGRLGALSEELRSTPDPVLRIERGAALVRGANEFFADYLAHINEEERTVVPAIDRHFSTEQIVAMRRQVEESMPVERLTEFLGWMLPALNANELTGIFAELKRGAPAEVLGFMTGLAAAHVPGDRRSVVCQRAGI
jgi:Hemerythrin HHE cation binding domain